MGTLERRKRDKEKRIKIIIDSAEKVIFSKSINSATMDEIAEVAEVSKGTLYFYFDSKHELILSIADRGLSFLIKSYQEIFTSQIRGKEMIKKFGNTGLDFVEQYPNYCEILNYFNTYGFSLQNKKSKYAIKCDQKILEILTYIFRALQIGIQDGSIKKNLNPRLITFVMWVELRGLIQLHDGKKIQRYSRLFDSNLDSKKILDFFIESILSN